MSNHGGTPLVEVEHVERPSTIAEACRLLDQYPNAKVVAGGTACILMLRQGLISPDRLISLQGLHDAEPEWSAISVRRKSIRIGAGASLTEVSESGHIRELLPSLAAACSLVGNVRVKNVATLGGNIAESDYASDPPPVLVSLGAYGIISSSRGERTVTMSDFITDYYTNVLEHGEILREVIVPKPRRGERATYLKYITRSSEDRPCVGVAAVARQRRGRVGHLRVVVGAVAGSPKEVPEAVASLLGKVPDRKSLAECARSHAQAITPLSDLRGSAHYRRQMIEVHVRRALEAVIELAEH